MSTILKAVQELERRGAPAMHSAAMETAPDSRLRWRALAVAGAVVLVAVAVGLLLLLPLNAPQLLNAPQSKEGATAAVPPEVAPRQPARVPPLVIAPAQGDRPWGVVAGKARPALPSGAAPSAPAVPAVASAPQPRQEAPAPKAVARVPSTAPGEPHVQVKSISYSSAAAQRTVTLQIDGARAVALHEGESVNGLEVQLILPDSVYLRRDGNVFAVAPTPG